MKLRVTLSRGPVTGPDLLAQTSDPEIVCGVVKGLYRNWILEADGDDQIFDRDFTPSVASLCHALEAAVREQACRQWPRDDGEARDAAVACCDSNGSQDQPGPAPTGFCWRRRVTKGTNHGQHGVSRLGPGCHRLRSNFSLSSSHQAPVA